MANSTKAVEAFKNKITEALDYHQEFLLAVYNKKRQASLEARLVEQFIMSIAVLWEAFINDLLIAYVVENPNTCLTNLKDRINQSITSKFGIATAKRVYFGKPKKVNRVQALALIDPEGMNITAKSADDLSNRANQLLVASSAIKFSLNSDDRELINLVISIRNYIGHRSKRSREALKDSIASIETTGINSPLKAKLTTVGAYLRYKTSPTGTRATFIVQRLLDISDKLG
ncbi:MAG TPA: hypothetical protein VE732_03120 [Nitrososphaera sp.]|jgi:hypothetical protein|nr:hypothetical protein [Nitrososphaera sp.]